MKVLFQISRGFMSRGTTKAAIAQAQAYTDSDRNMKRSSGLRCEFELHPSDDRKWTELYISGPRIAIIHHYSALVKLLRDNYIKPKSYVSEDHRFYWFESPRSYYVRRASFTEVLNADLSAYGKNPISFYKIKALQKHITLIESILHNRTLSEGVEPIPLFPSKQLDLVTKLVDKNFDSFSQDYASEKFNWFCKSYHANQTGLQGTFVDAPPMWHGTTPQQETNEHDEKPTARQGRGLTTTFVYYDEPGELLNRSSNEV